MRKAYSIWKPLEGTVQIMILPVSAIEYPYIHSISPEKFWECECKGPFGCKMCEGTYYFIGKCWVWGI